MCIRSVDIQSLPVGQCQAFDKRKQNSSPFTRSQCGELIRLFYGLAAAIGNLQAIFEISVVVEKTPERLPLVVLRVKLPHVLVK